MKAQPDDGQNWPTAATMQPHIIRGSLWMIVMRWSIRGIGLVSTLVLARLLTPADFGIVAMAMLVVGLIEVFGETGQQLALIRFSNLTREHFDSAWTAQILVSLILGTVVLLVSPLAELYFGEPRAVTLVQVLSIRVYATGFENIGTVLFRKELNFNQEFRYGIYKKLIPFFITLGLAFALRNYWALVIGIVFGQIVSVVLSYVVHPYRPRICFSRIKEIWSFSIWMLVSSVGAFVYGRASSFVVGGMGDPRALGNYMIAGEAAMTPTAELIAPLSRALFPSYAKLGHDLAQLRNVYLNVLSVISILVVSTSAGMALVARDMVLVALGPQWHDAAPLVVWLALTGGVGAISTSVMLVLQVAADPRRVALQSWTRVLLIVPILAIALLWHDVEIIAAARLAGTVLLMPTFFYQLMQILPISVGQILGVTWRPVVAAAIMAAAVIGVSAQIPDLHPALRLVIEVPVGATAYLISLLLLWLAVGQPSGAERAAVRFLASRLAWLRPGQRNARPL